MLKIKNSSQKVVARPFGAHFTTRLKGVNNKLICALSRETDEFDIILTSTCIDDR